MIPSKDLGEVIRVAPWTSPAGKLLTDSRLRILGPDETLGEEFDLANSYCSSMSPWEESVSVLKRVRSFIATSRSCRRTIQPRLPRNPGLTIELSEKLSEEMTACFESMTMYFA